MLMGLFVSARWREEGARVWVQASTPEPYTSRGVCGAGEVTVVKGGKETGKIDLKIKMQP